LARPLLVGGVALLIAPGAGPASAAGPSALVVLPPGEGNTITLADFAQNQAATGCTGLGPHTCDQEQLYSDWGFRNGALDPQPSDVADPSGTEHPEAGLEIVRDHYGVPHIYGSGPDQQTIDDRIAYGIGYAQAEDRLFQMEVLRRASEGTLSALLGSAYLTMDTLTLRDSETPQERAEAIATELTPGQRAAFNQYADGVNAIIKQDQANPSLLPAGFTLTQDLPIAPWTTSDSLAVLILETKQVAESAGNEVGYGALARALKQRYGLDKAAAILNDVQLTRQPGTPTSVPYRGAAKLTTDGRKYTFVRRTLAGTRRQIAALGPTVVPADQAMLNGANALAKATHALGLPTFGSNAWAIAPLHSATHHALLWGAPQVGYYVPEVLYELETQGGDFHVHGVTVPGAGPGIVIGYTPHFAWSITTAQDDQVDTYVDHIRRAPGGYQYFWRGAWQPVESRTQTIRVRAETPSLPLVGQLPAPTYTSYPATFYRTMHGPLNDPTPCTVYYLDAAAGVSYCKARSFWNVELWTGVALTDINQATGLSSFTRAVREGVAGFNFMYADDRGNIGYWHTGRIPIRPRGVDPRLPVNGSGTEDWTGFLSPRLWPSVVDPKQGWIASWNNKPQRSWPDTGDGSLWGPLQRVRQPMRLLAARRRFTLTEAWRAAERTGELDLRATLGFKPFVTRLPQQGLTALERQAVSLVRGWDGTAFAPAGIDRSDPTKVASPAFAIFDAWFAALENLVAAPVFGPIAPPGSTGPAAGLQSFTQTPATTSPKYEFFDDYDSFVYDVLSGRARAAKYLGPHGTWQSVSRAALAQAVAALTKAQGADPSRWRAPMPRISFESLDVTGIPSIPWENRGTWAQAVALP
jgi:penicillin amidase